MRKRISDYFILSCKVYNIGNLLSSYRSEWTLPSVWKTKYMAMKSPTIGRWIENTIVDRPWMKSFHFLIATEIARSSQSKTLYQDSDSESFIENNTNGVVFASLFSYIWISVPRRHFFNFKMNNTFSLRMQSNFSITTTVWKM